MNKPTRTIHTIFLHCSDSDRPSHDNIETVRGWHLARDFDDIGYHYFIRKNGEVKTGRDINLIPASQRGHNTGSIAICLSGSKEFTQNQFKSLRGLIEDYEKVLGMSLKIRLHNEVNEGKTCPNFTLEEAGLNYCKAGEIKI
tara:strand:- start:65 stop:490 length:426 start_codon:yes stop_codon:yes gene_type:complete